MATRFYFHNALSGYSNLPTAEQSSLTSDKDAEAQTINHSMDDTVGPGPQVQLRLSSLANTSANDYYFTRFVSHPIFVTTGMGGDPPGQGQDNPQPDRVGADDDGVTRDGPDEQEDANCWGKFTSDAANDNGGDGLAPGEFGQHAANPVNDPEGEEEDNETPREGVGNQVEDHPSDHADTVGPRFGPDEECTED